MAARGVLCLGALCRDASTPLLCDPKRQQCLFGVLSRVRRNNLRPRMVVWPAGIH